MQGRFPLRHHYRRLWGAEPEPGDNWRFSLWSPDAATVQVIVAGRRVELEKSVDGFFRTIVPAQSGEAYVFVIDGNVTRDPAARAQRDAIGDTSVLTDPRDYAWTSDWAGRRWEDAVIYELHIGTFTAAGTFAAAATRLAELAALGITAVEIMPVAQFPGIRGWGYDGVQHYAPHCVYGSPDDMKRFVETAQRLGMMVLLDVVYNHFGPDGAAVPSAFFDPDRQTPWGAAIDFTARPVRDFFIDNALMWLTEYRLDGLRFDAVHEIHDPSRPPILAEIATRVGAAGLGRPIHFIAEDERNVPTLQEAGLFAAEWNDDYHHALHVLLTGETMAHYGGFAADPLADLMRALAEGYVEQGQPRPGRDTRRGAPSGHLPWTAFVNHNQNHDQIGNRADGARLVTLAGDRAAQVAHALLLTAPFIPMLFMGEEQGDDTPFYFFCDYSGELATAYATGRVADMATLGFDTVGVPDPNHATTMERSRPFTRPPDDRSRAWLALTRSLLKLRADRIVPLMRSGKAGHGITRRTGARALCATWPFATGQVEVAVNLGSVADVGLRNGLPDFVLGDLLSDRFAIDVRITTL